MLDRLRVAHPYIHLMLEETDEVLSALADAVELPTVLKEMAWRSTNQEKPWEDNELASAARRGQSGR
jgi:hypothetical protein